MIGRIGLCLAALITLIAIIVIAIGSGGPANAQGQTTPTPSTKTATDYVIEGLDLYHKGQWRQALDDFAQANRLDPKADFAANLQELGWSYFVSKYRMLPDAQDSLKQIFGDYSRVIDEANAAINEKSTKFNPHYLRALVLLQINITPNVLGELNLAIVYDDACGECYVARGRVRMAFHEYEAAIADFQHSLAVIPNNVVAYDYLARSDMEQGNWSGAVNAVRQMQRIDPTYPSNQFILDSIDTRADVSFQTILIWAIILAGVVPVTRRYGIWRRAAGFHFRWPLPVEVAQIGLVTGIAAVLIFLADKIDLVGNLSQFMIGLFALALLIIAPSVISFAQVYRAKRMIEQGKYQSALAHLTRWKKFPLLPRLSQNALDRLEANALMFSGKLEQAESLMRTVITHDRNKQEHIVDEADLGWILLRMGKSEEAANVLKTAIQQNPKHPLPYSRLAEVYLTNNDNPQEALRLVDQMLEAEDSLIVEYFVDADLLADRAWALAQTGQSDEGIRTIQQAFREAQNNYKPMVAGLHYRAAQIWSLCGTESQIVEEANSIQDIDPQGIYLQLTRQILDRKQRNSRQ